MRKSLSGEAWTVRAVGDLADVPAAVADVEFYAKVPGCVHTDLMQAGLLEDPNVGFNERKQRWVGNTDWQYRCVFEVGAELLAHERVDLICEGLDTIATVRLNEVVLGATANMHHSHRFDARAALQAGRNELVIDFRAPLAHIREEERQRGKRPVNGDWDPYPYIRKMASNFGWDWGPLVPTVGIWRDIYLHAWNGVRMASVRPLMSGPSDAGDWTVSVHVSLEHSGSQNACSLLETVRAEARGSSCRVIAGVGATGGNDASACVDVPCGATDVTITLTVHNPRLWWPVGYGEQHLYPLEVRIDDTATTLDAWSACIGFRTVRLNTDPDGHGSAFTIEVNGSPIFCKGANWIPEGMFPSALTPEVYRERVQQARDANMNMLRVWGGGIYEAPAFYEACDELGLLVWQDFMFACATYPEEEPYPALIETEARHNIARLSKHPSVVLWCGGNECIWAYKSWGFGFKLKRGQTWGRMYYLDLLPRLVAGLDPTRPYWPNSPYSGTFDADPLDTDHGNRHTWDVRMEDYRQFVPRFVSEFGHQSPPNMATLRETWPDDALAIDSKMMEH
ncbi:MAG: glycoside hydrolase family 2 protein, partial [Phycisphaerae bacterium]|nr:glycoside hydrolase family 2 protein [Phycisphaerae bacterium]